jgi:hypothetical protein
VTGAGTRRARADAAIPAARGPLPPVLLFACAEDWAAWLEAYRATAPGAWLRLARKGAPLRTIAYAEAVEAALCYGWIDSLARRCDEASWAQRFARRAQPLVAGQPSEGRGARRGRAYGIGGASRRRRDGAPSGIPAREGLVRLAERLRRAMEGQQPAQATDADRHAADVAAGVLARRARDAGHAAGCGL